MWKALPVLLRGVGVPRESVEFQGTQTYYFRSEYKYVEGRKTNLVAEEVVKALNGQWDNKSSPEEFIHHTQ